MTPRTPHQRNRARKKPIQSRSQQTVIAIIEACARILEEQGPRGFNTNAVAELAGVSIGTLYQYFTDKDALLGGLILRETSVFLDEAQTAASIEDGRTAIVGVIEAAIRHQFRRPGLARIVDFEQARFPFDPDTQNVREKFLALLTEVLSRPEIPRIDHLTVMSRDILTIIKGMVDSAGELTVADDKNLLNRICRAVFGYLSLRFELEGPLD